MSKKQTAKKKKKARPAEEPTSAALAIVDPEIEKLSRGDVAKKLASEAATPVIAAIEKLANLEINGLLASRELDAFKAGVLLDIDEKTGLARLDDKGRPKKRPLEQVKSIVLTLADRLGVDAPSFETTGGAGRPTEGRNELALVLYHNDPEAKKEKGERKDTLIAKRVTDGIRRFLVATGQLQTRQPKAAGEGETSIPLRAWKVVFLRLWELLERDAPREDVKDQDHKFLALLWEQAGMDQKLQDKWTEGQVSEMWKRVHLAERRVIRIGEKGGD